MDIQGRARHDMFWKIRRLAVGVESPIFAGSAWLKKQTFFKELLI